MTRARSGLEGGRGLGRGSRHVFAGDGTEAHAAVSFCPTCHRTVAARHPAGRPAAALRSGERESPAAGDEGGALAMPIGALMNRDVLCVGPDLSIDALEALLLDRELSGAPVVDREGRLLGFVAATDIVRDVHDRGNDDEVEMVSDRVDRDDIGLGFHAEPVTRTVADIMRAVAFELTESCPLVKAAALMAIEHVHRIPVVSDEGQVVGIVTALDLLRAVAENHPLATPRPRSRSRARPGPGEH